MKYYFVDYENVHIDGLNGYEVLEDGDVICILYTDADKSFSLELLEALTTRGALVESFKAETGSKNALDFQLSSYLGYKIAKNEALNNSFYIVSKDKGYDRVVEFWSKRGITIKRILNLDINPRSEKDTKVTKNSNKAKKSVKAKKQETVNATGETPKKKTANAVVEVSDKKTANAVVEVSDKKTVDAVIEVINKKTVDATIEVIDKKAVNEAIEVPDNDKVSVALEASDKEVTDKGDTISDGVKDTLTEASQNEKPVSAKKSATKKTKKKIEVPDGGQNSQKENEKKTDDKATKEDLLKLLTDEEYSDAILEIFNKYKTKQAITRAFDKEFKDSKKTSLIYKKLKPLVKEKHKS